MTVRIKTRSNKGLLQAVNEMADINLNLCFQCKKCSSGCPVARLTQQTPSDLVKRLQLGAGDELLGSDIIWLCVSCQNCYTRCPMQINVSAVMDILRSLALIKKASKPKGNAPLFNRIFLSMVKSFGRSYELPLIAFYKLGTGSLISDLDKLPEMLTKRKISLLPPLGAYRQVVSRIFRIRAHNKKVER